MAALPLQPDRAYGQQDVAYMQLALRLAAEAAEAGEVPVGAVVVRDGVVVGTGRNSPIQSCDPSAHAELAALRHAATTLGNYRLEDCTLYVTLEPCAMCSGGILNSRVKRVVFGATDPKTGCAGSVLDLFSLPRLNHQTTVDGGVLAEQSGALLQDFFKQRRDKQRELAVPLREDALRTPDRFFDALHDYPWVPQYINDLQHLAGLRMHFVDEGPRQGADTYLCLHPIPGWSFHLGPLLVTLIGQGNRVLAPDLIGFGKSDKPKREDAHSLDFHCHYLREWLQRLDTRNVTLVVSRVEHPLVKPLLALAHGYIQDVFVQPLPSDTSSEAESDASKAPYPDHGHRAAERAFLSPRIREINEMSMKL
jgi:tRNA(adenine34) deaminase